MYTGIVALLALQVAYMYLPFMQDLFGSAALGWEGIALSTVVAFSVVPVIAVDKWIANRAMKKSTHVHTE